MLLTKGSTVQEVFHFNIDVIASMAADARVPLRALHTICPPSVIIMCSYEIVWQRLFSVDVDTKQRVRDIESTGIYAFLVERWMIMRALGIDPMKGART